MLYRIIFYITLLYRGKIILIVIILYNYSLYNVISVNQKRLTPDNHYVIIDNEKGRRIFMAVKLRLKRMGAKKAPTYRIVAADSRVKRDGIVIEELGSYNPTTDPATVIVKEEEIMKWLRNGAIPTDTVRNILSKEGIMKKFHEERQGK